MSPPRALSTRIRLVLQRVRTLLESEGMGVIAAFALALLAGCAGGAVRGGDDPGARPTDLISARVEPPTALLESIDGSMPVEAFRLIGVQRDGVEVTLSSVVWSLDLLRPGGIDSMGVYTASGTAGGVVTVSGSGTSISGAMLSANATVTVTIRRTILGPGVDTSVSGHFDGAAVADPTSIDVLYPLEGAVMPGNVYPPTIQWASVGAAGDFFEVRVTKPHVEIVALLVHTGADFAHGWFVPRDVWRPVADSDMDDPVAIEVERFETATSRLIAAAATRTMRLARGSIFGNVYYEDRTSTANILRIETETATLTNVITNPYPTAEGTRCVGCHALTRDGRYAFGTNGQTQAVYDLTVDLSSDPPPSRYPLTAIGAAPSVVSFDATGTYFVGGTNVSAGLVIFDAGTGVAVVSTGLPSANSGYPSWSPDGMRIAFSGDVVVAPTGHAEAGHPIGGDLYVADRAGGSLDFASRLVHSAASLATMPEGGSNDTHAAWSPDSRYIAFQHGPGTFTHVVRNPGAIYLLGTDGALHRLDHANGGAGATDGYWPTFAPYVTTEADGRRYFWMAFYARRDYGNEWLGSRGSGRRQLWVAAIDTEPSSGVDPSFVPYWLPGQSTASSNFSAFWAPEACRATGAACSLASECCSDRCDSGAMGELTCTAPPPEECRVAGMSCGGDGDCCSDYRCDANVCTDVIL